MNTCTIILPIDMKRGMQLLALLEMFSKNAVVPLREITKVIPKSTFHALLYKLKLLNGLVKERYGFALFVFEKLLDFSSMKDLKADFDKVKDVKVMKLNAKIEIAEIEGNSFVVLTKAFNG